MIYKPENLARYFSAKEEYNGELEILTRRVQELVDLILDTFKVKLDWWSYQYYEDENLDPPPAIESTLSVEEEFPLHISVKGSYHALDTDDWDYATGFPVNFLFMNNKEITDVIKGQIKKTREAEAERTAEKKAYQQKKKELEKALAAEEKKLKKQLGIK